MKKLFLLIAFAMTTCGAFAQIPADEPAPVDGETMRANAARLKMHMTRADVVGLLGPATWAVVPGDGGELALEDSSIQLELRWRNPGCMPVVASFDEQMRLIGWEEGRVCMEEAEIFEPDDAYSCEKEDRDQLCELSL